MNPLIHIILLEFRSKQFSLLREYYSSIHEISDQPALLYSVVARRLPDPKRLLNLVCLWCGECQRSF